MADEDQSTEELLETFKALDDLGKAPYELVGRIVINLSGVEEVLRSLAQERTDLDLTKHFKKTADVITHVKKWQNKKHQWLVDEPFIDQLEALLEDRADIVHGASFNVWKNPKYGFARLRGPKDKHGNPTTDAGKVVDVRMFSEEDLEKLVADASDLLSRVERAYLTPTKDEN